MNKKPYSWLEISKKALLANAAQYKKIIAPGLLAPVIKGNGYGHDIFLVADVLNQCADVDYLCVAYLSEALALREKNIEKPLLVMSCIDDDVRLAAQNNIELLVSDEHDVARIFKYKPKKPIGVHVKIDTGLARFGVLPENALQLCETINQSDYFVLRGVYTHFAQSHSEDHTFTNKQKEAFYQALAVLHKHGIHPPLIHAANSAATTIHELPLCNFFRVGIGLYGWWSSESVQKRAQQKYPHVHLKPALTWKACIDRIKTIPANTFVGYDCTFQTKRCTRAAIIPVGYTDGYDFRLANKGRVLIKNQLAPIIGKVAMNMCMVDITDIKCVSEGDEVILLGDHPGVTTHDLAQLNGSNNPREAIVRINSALPRILVD